MNVIILIVDKLMLNKNFYFHTHLTILLFKSENNKIDLFGLFYLLTTWTTVSVRRKALRMAREVADETGTLMGGNISNTGIYDPDNPESIEKVKLINKVF